MSVDLKLAPKQKRPKGEVCCDPVVYPDIERAEAERPPDNDDALLRWNACARLLNEHP